ncbi:MAG TPA: flagellar hook-basal body complex protein FliE [Candidatus Baltobacteraceae bacterium]|nr:flagellar hook-basal body complex protein FliE [Candidatus Baltobacteraceae bacterium]
MTVEPLLPDAAPQIPLTNRPALSADAAFARALDEFGSILTGAQTAEDAFANGAGSLQEAVYERARADVALSVATAAASRAAQAIGSIMNMQV